MSASRYSRSLERQFPVGTSFTIGISFCLPFLSVNDESVDSSVCKLELMQLCKICRFVAYGWFLRTPSFQLKNARNSLNHASWSSSVNSFDNFVVGLSNMHIFFMSSGEFSLSSTDFSSRILCASSTTSSVFRTESSSFLRHLLAYSLSLASYLLLYLNISLPLSLTLACAVFSRMIAFVNLVRLFLFKF